MSVCLYRRAIHASAGGKRREAAAAEAAAIV
jgi:hypothetical protein